jgi:hypothetical protein
VTIKGSYPSFAGQYDYLISPEGDIVIHSAFKYSGDDFYARETGTVFSLPHRCERLEWDRQAEFSVYPPDHIGRPHGEAKPVADHGSQVPPTWEWSADNSPIGCADFRSTKRHIHWATMTYPDSGAGLLILSNGSQNVRAAFNGDIISLYVTDWYGGTESSGEWVENYGRGKLIKNGDTLESTIRFRFLPPRKPAEKEGQ